MAIIRIIENSEENKWRQTMAAEVDFQKKDGYVYAGIKGSTDKGGLLSVFEKIMIYSTVQQSPKMLVDCRGIETVLPLEEIASISDKFNNIQDDYEGMTSIGITFAFLINDELHDLNIINEALYGGEEQPTYLGSNYDEAEKWLLSKEN
jgi:hypothetical protein